MQVTGREEAASAFGFALQIFVNPHDLASVGVALENRDRTGAELE